MVLAATSIYCKSIESIVFVYLFFLASGGQVGEGNSESVTTAALDALVSVTQMVPPSDVLLNALNTLNTLERLAH